MVAEKYLPLSPSQPQCQKGEEILEKKLCVDDQGIHSLSHPRCLGEWDSVVWQHGAETDEMSIDRLSSTLGGTQECIVQKQSAEEMSVQRLTRHQ